ncbi:uncharacterized protein [Leptinotarsa decemlineata]|uniref:uncharacterized protein n=1 Tax=Leptinotarsa decemlineata TaxID=7539 RepID=UPI003D3099FF
MELLGCCVRNCYFQLKDEFFTQDEGLPMGSPLSPVIANIYREWFETLAIEEAHKKPRVWLRYVDDTFIIWNHGNTELDAFLKHINSVRPSITFTMEKEIHNELPFLDVLVKRTDTKWETSVYRKPTHTGQYLNHESNHHQSTKRGIIKTLLDRAFGLCNTKEGLEKELDIIKSDLRRNGYSKAMIEKTLAKRQQEPRKEEKPSQPVLALPYIRGLSERIRRIGSKYNIRTCFRSGNTIRSSLTKTRPPNADCDSKNCIYRIPCECGKSYIGATKRPLNIRIAEHKKHTQRGETSKSGIADHVWTHQHNIEWSQAEILHREEHWFRRKFKEAAYMLSNNVFSQASVDIRNIWKPIIKREMTNSRQIGHLSRNQ